MTMDFSDAKEISILKKSRDFDLSSGSDSNDDEDGFNQINERGSSDVELKKFQKITTETTASNINIKIDECPLDITAPRKRFDTMEIQKKFENFQKEVLQEVLDVVPIDKI